MSYSKIQELAKKFAHKTVKEERDRAFNEQRLRMKEFYLFFYRSVRGLTGALEGDIRTLKERDFDPSILKILIKCYRDLLSIVKTSDPERPYIMGEKFANYVLDKPNSSVLENLDFLIKHYLKSSKIETQTGPMLGEPRFNTIEKIQEIARAVRKFMAENPLIPIPGSEPPPPISLLNIKPEQQDPLKPLDLTNPALPFAKKKLDPTT